MATFGTPVDEIAHVQRLREFVDAIAQRLPGHAVQGPVIADVLPRGQSRVEAAAVGHHAERPLDGHGVPRGIHPVNPDFALVRGQ
jgi:hypothetical protein